MPQPTPLVRLCRVVALVVLLLWGAPAGADVITLTPGDFAGTRVIDFTEVPLGTPVVGLTINGVSFGFGDTPGAAEVLVAGYFGTTSWVEGPTESYRDCRRAHSERGWTLWDDPVGFHPRYVSARCAWC